MFLISLITLILVSIQFYYTFLREGEIIFQSVDLIIIYRPRNQDARNQNPNIEIVLPISILNTGAVHNLILDLKSRLRRLSDDYRWEEHFEMKREYKNIFNIPIGSGGNDPETIPASVFSVPPLSGIVKTIGFISMNKLALDCPSNYKQIGCIKGIPKGK